MLFCDSHTHSNFSFDAEQSVSELCASAASKGINRIALTDHYDIDCILDGFYDDYDAEGAHKEAERCRSVYGGSTDIVFGIELGQPHLREREAHEFIKKHGIEFVIASIHNLDKVPDYIFINYETVPQPLIDNLYERYVRELCLAAAFNGAHTLAHATYPVRYISRDGRSVDVKRFYDLYKQLFKVMKENGVALELNTSGIRKGYGMSPDRELLSFYADCGGELVSCGSDAHIVGEVGADVKSCTELLRSLGFKYLTCPAHNGPEQILID